MKVLWLIWTLTLNIYDWEIFVFKGLGNETNGRQDAPLHQPEPELEWDCKECSFDLQIEQREQTWGFYDDVGLGCKPCKEKCAKDTNCNGIQCFDIPSPDNSEVSGRAIGGLRSCMWMNKMNLADVNGNTCKNTTSESLTCTKNYKRK